MDKVGVRLANNKRGREHIVSRMRVLSMATLRRRKTSTSIIRGKGQGLGLRVIDTKTSKAVINTQRVVMISMGLEMRDRVNKESGRDLLVLHKTRLVNRTRPISRVRIRISITINT